MNKSVHLVAQFLLWFCVISFVGNDLVCAKPPVVKHPKPLSRHRGASYEHSYKIIKSHFYENQTYRTQPHFEDVEQGDLGDCYLLARLAAIAATYPSWIESMVQKYTGPLQSKEQARKEGNERLEFYNVNFRGFRGRETPVLVSNEFYARSFGQEPLYAKVTSDDPSIWKIFQSKDPTNWVALIEKAFAAHYGGYQSISGTPNITWILTGERDKIIPISLLDYNSEELARVLYEAVMVDRAPVVLGTKGSKRGPYSTGFDRNHAMAVISVSEDLQEIRLYDPHGEEHYVSPKFLFKRFSKMERISFPEGALNQHEPIAPPHHVTKEEYFQKKCSNITMELDALEENKNGRPNGEHIAEEVSISKKIKELWSYVDSLRVPETSEYWPFPWSVVACGLKTRVAHSSSIDQAYVPTCGPTLVTSIFLDEDPKRLIDVAATLFQTGGLQMADGTILTTTHAFRKMRHVYLQSRNDPNDIYQIFDYFFQGAVANSRKGMPMITSKWRGTQHPSLTSATTLAGAARLARDFVGMKHVYFTHTNEEQAFPTAKGISQMIERYGLENLYVGMLVKEPDNPRLEQRTRKALPNHFLRIRGGFDFGSGTRRVIKVSAGLEFREIESYAKPDRVSYLRSTHGKLEHRQVTWRHFSNTTYGFVVATNDDAIGAEISQLGWKQP